MRRAAVCRFPDTLAPRALAVALVLAGLAWPFLLGATSAAPAAGTVESAPRPVYPEHWNEPALDWIGATLARVMETFGPPDSLFPFRGAEAWHDDVVFYYESDFFYFFWWDNRVWQVRYDKRFRGTVCGVSMGSTRDAVRALYGDPVLETAESLIYQLPDRGFPLRGRFVFENQRLSDVYLYRSDF